MCIFLGPMTKVPNFLLILLKLDSMIYPSPSKLNLGKKGKIVRKAMTQSHGSSDLGSTDR
jgi:hypothetical protein